MTRARPSGAALVLALLLPVRAAAQPPLPPLAAAVAETDAAYEAVRTGDVALASKPFSAAGKLLDRMLADTSSGERAAVAAERWYRLVANTWLAIGRVDDARFLVQHALGQLPRAASLYVLRGAILEMSASGSIADPRGGGAEVPVADEEFAPNMGGRRASRNPTPTRLTPEAARDRLVRQLQPAITEYRRALDLDPHVALARLHLGWIHMLADDSRARDELASGLADATSPADTYLAHLFLGALAAKTGDAAGALAHYETAVQLEPAWQSAWIAASHAHAMLGHQQAARELMRIGSSRNVAVDDPWWMYRLGGIDETTLRWLHEEAGR